MSFLDSIKHVLSSIGNGLLSIFSHDHLEKGKVILVDLIQLSDKAIPVVQLIASMTPTTADDLIVEALKKLNLTLESFLEVTSKTETALDVSNGRGLKLTLAAEVLRQSLVNLVTKGEKIKIGDTVISTVEAVLGMNDSELRTAAHNAFQLFDSTKKIAGK